MNLNMDIRDGNIPFHTDYVLHAYKIKDEAHNSEKNGKYRVEVEDGKIIELEEAKVKEFKVEMSSKLFATYGI